jgi:adenosine deaminase
VACARLLPTRDYSIAVRRPLRREDWLARGSIGTVPTKAVQSNGATQASIEHVPKIDLHRHLLGSARPETLWELARQHDVDWGLRPLAEFRNAVVHKSPPGTLPAYITPWEIFRSVVQTPDDIRRIALEAAVDARRDGVRYVEFRAGLPGMPITDGESPQTRIPSFEYLQAIAEAFAEVAGIACRLVAGVTRHAVGAADRAHRRKFVARFFEVLDRFHGDLIVGVDLSGLESGWPADSFKDVFGEARAMKLPITIHAGETEGPEEVWAAIDDLGASRIGHGTTAPQDPKLIEELVRRKVVLEVCPTAGWLVGTLKDRSRHPVIDCWPPVPYVICTDNPTLNSSTQSNELQIAASIARVDAQHYARWQFEVASRAVFDPAALCSVMERYATERFSSQSR